MGRSNGPKIYKLQKDIFGYKQGDQEVLMYFNNLTALWSELDMLMPSISCICDAEKKYDERLSQQRMLQFLVGLKDDFEQVKQQILLIEPLPTIEKTYGMIIQVEDQMKLQGERGDGDFRMVMQVGRQPQYIHKSSGYEQKCGFKKKLTKEERRRLKCTHCLENGHEAHECFKLPGYLDWYKRLREERGLDRVNFMEERVNYNEELDVKSESGRNCTNEISKTLGSLFKLNWPSVLVLSIKGNRPVMYLQEDITHLVYFQV